MSERATGDQSTYPAQVRRVIPVIDKSEGAKIPIHAGPTIPLVRAQPYAAPARPRTEPSKVLRRELTAPPQPASYTQDEVPAVVVADLMSRPKRSWLQAALLGMALAVFAIGVAVNVQTLQANKDAKAQVMAFSKQSHNTPEETVPSEGKPDINSYKVAPNMPRFLKIAKIGVNARIKPMGVNNKNEINSPGNVNDAGWYNASVRPGDTAARGATLIDGHVYGPTSPGVFAELRKLKAGDLIQVVRGDDKIFEYQVVKTQNFDVDALDMNQALTSAQPDKQGLNLITCAGKYDRLRGEYSQRMIVFAVLK